MAIHTWADFTTGTEVLKTKDIENGLQLKSGTPYTIPVFHGTDTVFDVVDTRYMNVRKWSGAVFYVTTCKQMARNNAEGRAGHNPDRDAVPVVMELFARTDKPFIEKGRDAAPHTLDDVVNIVRVVNDSFDANCVRKSIEMFTKNGVLTYFAIHSGINRFQYDYEWARGIDRYEIDYTLYSEWAGGTYGYSCNLFVEILPFLRYDMSIQTHSGGKGFNIHVPVDCLKKVKSAKCVDFNRSVESFDGLGETVSDDAIA